MTSTFEHPAVLNSARALAGEGFDVAYANVTDGGMVDEAVGRVVADEVLADGIEMQRAVETQRAGAHVDQRTAAVADLLVEREAPARTHLCLIIGVLRLGIGQCGQLLHDVG